MNNASDPFFENVKQLFTVEQHMFSRRGAWLALQATSAKYGRGALYLMTNHGSRCHSGNKEYSRLYRLYPTFEGRCVPFAIETAAAEYTLHTRHGDVRRHEVRDRETQRRRRMTRAPKRRAPTFVACCAARVCPCSAPNSSPVAHIRYGRHSPASATPSSAINSTASMTKFTCASLRTNFTRTIGNACACRARRSMPGQSVWTARPVHRNSARPCRKICASLSSPPTWRRCKAPVLATRQTSYF